MVKIVVASGNAGKVKELTELLNGLDIEVLSLKDFRDIGEIEEDGTTFTENAIKKARTVTAATGLIAMADDSGLEVDYLEGAPGIYSARFAGEARDDLQNNMKLLSLLKDLPDDKRTARFRCVIAVSTPWGETHTAEGACYGIVGREIRGDKGFGYDPLFYLPEYGKTFAELESETKNRISHRGKALAQAKGVLTTIIERVGAEL